MRPIIFMIALTISVYAFSQISEAKSLEKVINIGKVEKLEYGIKRICRLGYIEDYTTGNRAYSLVFTDDNILHNQDYTPDKVKTFGFLATTEELDYFYNFLKKGFKLDHIRSLDVGDVIVSTLPHRTGFMYINVEFDNQTTGMFKLKKRELERLFGKKIKRFDQIAPYPPQ